MQFPLVKNTGEAPKSLKVLLTATIVPPNDLSLSGPGKPTEITYFTPESVFFQTYWVPYFDKNISKDAALKTSNPIWHEVTSPLVSMGKFTEYLEGKVYSCIGCRANLARHTDIVSKQYEGTSGPAYLFKHAWVRNSLSTFHFGISFILVYQS